MNSSDARNILKFDAFVLVMFTVGIVVALIVMLSMEKMLGNENGILASSLVLCVLANVLEALSLKEKNDCVRNVLGSQDRL